MAFCSKCGTKFNDGARFCSICGQPNNATSSQQLYQQQYLAQPQEERHDRMYETWHRFKWYFIGAFALLYIIIMAASVHRRLGLSNDDTEEETYAVSDDVAKTGYNAGYQIGFQFGFEDFDNCVQSAYCIIYDTPPSSPEEWKRYNIFAENFKKGLRDGEKVR